MQNIATVSIIIPSYNHALFLKQRIDSILNQTFQDFEVIIIDDCSTDHSREIIECYRNHPKITRIIYNDRNSGRVFKQWINGIKKSAGKYIWIAESDDYAAPNFLEQTVRQLEVDATVGMVFTGTQTVTEEGEYLLTSAQDKPQCYQHLANFSNKIDKYNVAEFLITEMIITNASSVLFRKNEIVQVDFTELSKFYNTGDRFVYISIALKSKILFLPNILNYMRSHDNNTTKQNIANGNIHRDRLKIINFFFDKLRFSTTNLETLAKFYKNSYIYYITYGDYKENVQVLKNLKSVGKVSSTFYWVVLGYLQICNRSAIQLPGVKGIYYRLMISLSYFDQDCQK